MKASETRFAQIQSDIVSLTDLATVQFSTSQDTMTTSMYVAHAQVKGFKH